MKRNADWIEREGRPLTAGDWLGANPRRSSKFRAKVTMLFDVESQDNTGDVESEVWQEISDRADNAAYALAGTLNLAGIKTGRSEAYVDLEPLTSKRTSKRRR